MKLTSHELLSVDLIRLVENAPNLILVSLENINGTFQFIGNIKLMGIKKKNDQIGSLHIENVAPKNVKGFELLVVLPFPFSTNIL